DLELHEDCFYRKVYESFSQVVEKAPGDERAKNSALFYHTIRKDFQSNITFVAGFEKTYKNVFDLMMNVLTEKLKINRKIAKKHLKSKWARKK
ncbi:MAG: hypothetical protein ACRDAX_01140, partial [Propionibacteriaceae bacterium]